MELVSIPFANSSWPCNIIWNVSNSTLKLISFTPKLNFLTMKLIFSRWNLTHKKMHRPVHCINIWVICQIRMVILIQSYRSFFMLKCLYTRAFKNKKSFVVIFYTLFSSKNVTVCLKKFTPKLISEKMHRFWLLPCQSGAFC